MTRGRQRARMVGRLYQLEHSPPPDTRPLWLQRARPWEPRVGVALFWMAVFVVACATIGARS